MVDLIIGFGLGLSVGAWLVMRYIVPVALEITPGQDVNGNKWGGDADNP